MTTASFGKTEFKRLLWEGYGRTLWILWSLRWAIVAVVVAISTWLIIRHH